MNEPSATPASFPVRAYDLLVWLGNHAQSYLLFGVRYVWGIQLMQAGLGKLFNIDTPIAYFTQLGIPLPVENAWLVAFTETFGGLFLAFGFLTRLTMVPVIINFIVAYLTTEQEALHNLLKLDPDKFLAADPFPYLFAAVIVIVFGPGALSVDYLICRWRNRLWRSAVL